MKMRLFVALLSASSIVILVGGITEAAPRSDPSSLSSQGGPQPVTYAGQVAAILFEHCVQCHRPGEVAPFSLLSYEDAKKRAQQLAFSVESKQMPPWKAKLGYNEFHDANVLTPEKIAAIRAWADAGAPMGDPMKLPEPPKFSSEWTLGEPDAILAPPRPYKIAAEGRDDYRNFVIKTDYKETKWVRAMAVRPDNKRVVHHVIAFLDETGRAIELEKRQNDGQPGYSTFGGLGFIPSGALGGWAPGLRPSVTPDYAAFELKPGATIVLQMHYNKTGKEEYDRTQIGLYFAKEPPKQKMNLAWLANIGLRIPAGASNHVAKWQLRLPVDVTVYGAMPHMHLLGKWMKAYAITPDGKEVPLVWVEDWDFNWQMHYTFAKPIKLPRGSVVHVEAAYDNSADNPRQPSNPPRTVTWGEQTTDEMMLLVVPYTVDGVGIEDNQNYNSVLRPFGATFFGGGSPR